MSNFSFKIVFIGTGFPFEGGYSVEYRHYYSRVLTQHTLVVTLHPGGHCSEPIFIVDKCTDDM